MTIKITKKINDKLDVGTITTLPKLVCEKLIREGKAVIVKSGGTDMVTK